MDLALIKRRRKTTPKAKKAKPKRRILRRTTVKPGGVMIPSPNGKKAAKGRKAASPKPRTVAAWT